jgi:16S rRNA (cytidine1402-2'-O)-methyltransferase
VSEHLPACLYIVATPIGNLADMTERAIQVLNDVSVIAAEDTRHSGLLLQHYSIKKTMLSLHQHNEQQRSETLLAKLQQGESVALISDAGTPLISDPGYRLVSLIREHGIQVVPVPGSCALIAALSASGLASDRFCFEGFLPAKKSTRIQMLESLITESRTMIFYESPRRLVSTLSDLIDVFGEDRQACIARELTKLHETINTQSLAELLEWVENDAQQQKGECVLLLAGVEQTNTTDQAEIERVMSILIAEMPSKQAAKVGAQLLNINKNAAYDVALSLKK